MTITMPIAARRSQHGWFTADFADGPLPALLTGAALIACGCLLWFAPWSATLAGVHIEIAQRAAGASGRAIPRMDTTLLFLSRRPSLCSAPTGAPRTARACFARSTESRGHAVRVQNTRERDGSWS